MAGAYREKFPVGSTVHIASRVTLEQFRESWRLHHPLMLEQLDYADHEAVVQEIGFYHGGDALYRLAGIPGIWHEANLTAIATPAT